MKMREILTVQTILTMAYGKHPLNPDLALAIVKAIDRVRAEGDDDEDRPSGVDAS